MTWLAWRQARAGALAMGGALAALVLVLVLVVGRVSGLEPADLVPQLSAGERGVYATASVVLLLLPAIVGVFWGAPLIARELETGTHRLAWAQTVSPSRWLWTKLGLGALLTIVLTGITSLALTWWAGPIDDVVAAGGDRGGFYVARVAPLVFDTRGVVPVAHALFAFTSGAAIGLVLRRTLPAMAATLALVALAGVLTPLLIRPHLLPPERLRVPIPPDAPVVLGGEHPELHVQLPGAWVLSQHPVDRAGRAVHAPGSFATCVATGSDAAVPDCIAQLGDAGYRQELVVQPARRFWALQGIEAALFAALSAGLAAFCARRLRH